MEIFWTRPRTPNGKTPHAQENGHADRHATPRFGSFIPTADVFETRDDLVVEVELPGHEIEDITVEIEAHELTVTVQRTLATKAGRTYHRSERPDGLISRRFTLPQTVDCDNTRATYKNGVLTVELPKLEEVKPRTIPISTGD